MTHRLQGKRIAMLVASGFEQSEMVEPRKALQAAGATVEVVSVKRDAVKAWHGKDWGDEFQVDRHVTDVAPSRYDALVLPGGVINSDTLRMDPRAVHFVSELCESGKPVAAICHGPWLLVEADQVHQRRVTSYPSLRTDLKNAGAIWVDKAVVSDANLLTSRRPDDLPQFCDALVELISRPAPTRPVGSPVMDSDYAW